MHIKYFKIYSFSMQVFPSVFSTDVQQNQSSQHLLHLISHFDQMNICDCEL